MTQPEIDPRSPDLGLPDQVDQLLGLVGRVFANGSRHGFNPRSHHTKDLRWYLMLPCLTHSNIRYVSRLKWSNPRKRVAPSPTPWCGSY